MLPRPRLRIPFATRFWSHVLITYLPECAPRAAGIYPTLSEPYFSLFDYDPCWDWQGKRTGTQGLTGSLRLPAPSRRLIVAPRAALLLWEGAEDHTLIALNEAQRHLDAGHTVCDRPQCCNPGHLAWQQHKENIHEYIRKFRKLAGKPINPDNLTNSTP